MDTGRCCRLSIPRICGELVLSLPRIASFYSVLPRNFSSAPPYITKALPTFHPCAFTPPSPQTCWRFGQSHRSTPPCDERLCMCTAWTCCPPLTSCGTLQTMAPPLWSGSTTPLATSSSPTGRARSEPWQASGRPSPPLKALSSKVWTPQTPPTWNTCGTRPRRRCAAPPPTSSCASPTWTTCGRRARCSRAGCGRQASAAGARAGGAPRPGSGRGTATRKWRMLGRGASRGTRGGDGEGTGGRVPCRRASPQPSSPRRWEASRRKPRSENQPRRMPPRRPGRRSPTATSSGAWACDQLQGRRGACRSPPRHLTPLAGQAQAYARCLGRRITERNGR
uniref:Uncharacterized protein n=1 Tax=Auxenochlorella protothecoides TaxID=3075 RepID=A0A1D2A867_AUXPR